MGPRSSFGPEGGCGLKVRQLGAWASRRWKTVIVVRGRQEAVACFGLTVRVDYGCWVQCSSTGCSLMKY